MSLCIVDSFSFLSLSAEKRIQIVLVVFAQLQVTWAVVTWIQQTISVFFFCYWYLSPASALFSAILHQKRLWMLLTLKASQRSLKLIFHLISLDRCKIWASVGTKVCEKALGGDEPACLWAAASKGVRCTGQEKTNSHM